MSETLRLHATLSASPVVRGGGRSGERLSESMTDGAFGLEASGISVSSASRWVKILPSVWRTIFPEQFIGMTALEIYWRRRKNILLPSCIMVFTPVVSPRNEERYDEPPN